MDLLFNRFIPFYGKNGLIHITQSLRISIHGILSRLLHVQINLNESPEIAGSFGADDVMIRQIKMENDILKLLGGVDWFYTHKDFPSISSGLDPIYCEFQLKKDSLKLITLKCGDYNSNDIQFIHWIDMFDIEWILDY